MGRSPQKRSSRPTGKYAASLKYDVLTALGAWACAGDKHRQKMAVRLMTLITARYNWQEDSLTTGQREIAALWSVDERTVKREMARFRDLGWLVLKRPAARGRVACYGLDLAVITRATEDHWAAVGPDFEQRMRPEAPAPEGDPKVVAFPVVGQGGWGRVAARLQREDPALFAVWFAPLSCVAEEDGTLHLAAPSRFHDTFLRTHHLGRLQAVARVEGFAATLVPPGI